MSIPGTFAFPVDAGLARALAEAAAGFPDESNIYFVASYTRVPDDYGSPYDMNGPYASELEALAKAGELDLKEWENGQRFSYGVFGPFSTFFPELRAVPDKVTVVKIEVTPSDSDTPVPIDPADQYDALFYRATAVAKFAVPYYTQVYGMETGQAVLQNFQQPDVLFMAHMPWTEYVDIGGTGGVVDRVTLFLRDGSTRDGITGR